VQHHAVGFVPIAKALTLDGVFGEHVEAAPFELLAYGQQRRVEIAASDRARNRGTRSRHRNAREGGFLQHGVDPGRSNADRLGRQAIEAGAQLAPLAVSEALGRHVFHLLGFVGGAHRHDRERQ
jgi:hypothetical protein